MSHRIVESTEAEWTPHEKVWASVQQFDPRRGNLRGHIIAAAVGFGVAFVLIATGF
jgi:uncharacterized membrane protein